LRLAHLFDDLVGNCEQHRRKAEAECFGNIEVDDEVELRGLYDWQLGRLLSSENTPGVNASLPVCIRKACSLAHQPARCDVFS
jgi:hypothetical protein